MCSPSHPPGSPRNDPREAVALPQTGFHKDFVTLQQATSLRCAGLGYLGPSVRLVLSRSWLPRNGPGEPRVTGDKRDKANALASQDSKVLKSASATLVRQAQPTFGHEHYEYFPRLTTKAPHATDTCDARRSEPR